MLAIQRITTTRNTWVFALKGSVDSSNVAELEEALDAAFENKVFKLVIDLTRVEFVASSGFGCFLTSRDKANEGGGDLVFSGASPHVREIFSLMGLDNILRYFKEVPAAIGYLSVQSPASGKPVS